MTDEMTTGPAPYPQPALRVCATYHASDGRVPEEIVVEFGGTGPVEPDLVDRAVRVLAGVADQRAYTIAHQVAADQHGFAQAAAGAVLVDPARADSVGVVS